MSVALHIFDAAGEFNPARLAALREELHHAIADVSAILPLTALDLVVSHSRFVIPELGMTGFARNRGYIDVLIDAGSNKLDDPDRARRITALVAHEWHHIVRMRGPGLGRSLGEHFVSEGLAQAFEDEITGVVPFYARAVDGDDLHEFADRARAEMDATTYDHQAWFFGRRGDATYPRHGGYTLGYRLVREWLEHTGTSASASATIDAPSVLDAWRQGRIFVV